MHGRLILIDLVYISIRLWSGNEVAGACISSIQMAMLVR
jgi:hypothetical protein